MSKTKLLSFNLLLLVLMLSCSRVEEPAIGSGMGAICLNLQTEVSQTRADIVEGQLNPDDFKIEIINYKGIIFKRWATYAEYKEQVNTEFAMNAGGPYVIRATYGDSTASGFDAFFFKGEKEFFVEPQKTTRLDVVCRMANVKVAVVYGDNIKAAYTDYSTTVSNARGSLVFSKDCTEAGYLPAGNLTVDVQVVDQTGKTLYFRNSGTVEALAGDFITLNVDTEKVPEGGLSLTITYDTTTEDHREEVHLPATMLPSDAPLFVPEGFSSTTGVLSFIEGTLPEASVNINAEGTLAACSMTISSQYLTDHLNFPASVDFFNLTQGQKTLFETYGLAYTENMSGVKLANIDFSQLAKLLAYSEDAAANTHSFRLRVQDATGKIAEATFSIVPAMAQKAVSEIPEGNVWAARAYVDLTTDGDASLLYPEVQAEGSGTWIRPAFTSSVSGSVNSVTITGLNPQTRYLVRAGYNSYASEQTREFTTEQAAQVANAGFEDWTTENFSFVLGWSIFSRTKNIDWYRPWASGETDRWWDVNSKYTMPGNYSYIDLAQNRANFPSVAYTVQDVRSGSRSAMIYTTWVGYSVDAVDRLANGELFIGTANDNGERTATGHAFTSRPSSLKFAYKYSARNNENFYAYIEMRDASGAVIGSAELTTGPASDSWQEYVLPISYTQDNVKAASVYILFKSTSSSTPSYSEGSISIADDGSGNPKSYSGCYVGSTLYLDDIELIYQ